MDNQLITPQGEYLHTQFTGSNGTWRLIGSETNPASPKAMDTIDTFTNGAGQYTTTTRRKVAELYEAKKISL